MVKEENKQKMSKSRIVVIILFASITFTTAIHIQNSIAIIGNWYYFTLNVIVAGIIISLSYLLALLINKGVSK